MRIIRLAADTNNVVPAYTEVFGAYLEGGSDASSAAVYDGQTVSGNPAFTLQAAATTTSPYLNFGKGVPFRSGVSVDLTGTSPVLYLVVE